MGEKSNGYGVNENLAIAVSALSDDLKRQGQMLTELSASIRNTNEKVDNIESVLEEKLSEIYKKLEATIDKKLFVMQHANKSLDNSLVKEIMKGGVTEIKSVVSAMNKPVITRFQILLFPEQDAKLFYKIVFGRWFLMIVIALFLQISYQLLSRQQQINREIKLEAQKNDPVIKAWDYLYSQRNKTLQRKMDSALKRAFYLK